MRTAHIMAMSDERPPIIDAEFRVVRGPWPLSILHLSLVKLALRTAGAVAAMIVVGVVLVLLIAR